MTNGVRLEGHVMVPNLGYKKDAFLEPSLISNFLFDITLPIPPLLCLPLIVPTSKLVVNPTRVLPCHRRPMVWPLGRIAVGVGCASQYVLSHTSVGIFVLVYSSI